MKKRFTLWSVILVLCTMFLQGCSTEGETSIKVVTNEAKTRIEATLKADESKNYEWKYFTKNNKLTESATDFSNDIFSDTYTQKYGFVINEKCDFGMAFDAWRETNVILKQLSENSQADIRDFTATYFSVTQHGKPTMYIFRSEAQYIYFLLQHLLTAKVPICKCQFCGGYFVPKTKHKTLYCDRIIRDGKTCKQVAPGLKKRERDAAHLVTSEYERIKNMLFHRRDRMGGNKKSSVIDLTDDELVQWLEAATAAKKRCLAGALTEKEALAIIYVPTKKELAIDNSAEYTLVNSST